MNSIETNTNTQSVINYITLFPSDFKYHFESEYGTKYYTLAELKEKIITLISSYHSDIGSEKFIERCNGMLAVTMALACKNIDLPKSVIDSYLEIDSS